MILELTAINKGVIVKRRKQIRISQTCYLAVKHFTLCGFTSCVESHKVAHNTLFELERLCRKGGKSLHLDVSEKKRNLFNDFY